MVCSGLYPVSYTHLDVYKRQGKESLNEYSEQRANFPSVTVGVKTPKLLFEEEGSSRVRCV